MKTFIEWLKNEGYQNIGIHDGIEIERTQKAYDEYQAYLSKDMKVYAPSLVPSYIIESDGDMWFCHDDTFTNLQESDEVVFAKTPLEALEQFIEKFRDSDLTEEQKERFNNFMGGDPFDGFPEVKRGEKK